MKPPLPINTNPLVALGRRGAKKQAAPLPPKSDPFPEEKPTDPLNPAARAARLVASWNKLPDWKQKIAEQVIAAMQESP